MLVWLLHETIKDLILFNLFLPPSLASLAHWLFIFIVITGHKIVAEAPGSLSAYNKGRGEGKRGHQLKCPLYQEKQKGFPKASRTNISLAGTEFRDHPSCKCSWESECVAPSLSGEAERRKKLTLGFASQCFAYHWFPPQHIFKPTHIIWLSFSQHQMPCQRVLWW